MSYSRHVSDGADMSMELEKRQARVDQITGAEAGAIYAPGEQMFGKKKKSLHVAAPVANTTATAFSNRNTGTVSPRQVMRRLPGVGAIREV